MWAAQAAASGQRDAAQAAANANMYGSDQSLAGQRDTNAANRDIAGMTTDAQRQIADLTSSRTLEGQNRATDAGLAGTRDTNAAQQAIANANRLAQMYGFDTQRDIAGIANQPAMARIEQSRDLINRLFGGEGALGGALGGLLGGGAGAGGAGGATGGSPGGTVTPASAPVAPRFSPMDEQRLNARQQSLLARKLGGNRNALADAYAQAGMLPGGAGFADENADMTRQYEDATLGQLAVNTEQARNYNLNALPYYRTELDAYNAEQNREIERERNRIAAQNPLWGLLSNVLGSALN